MSSEAPLLVNEDGIPIGSKAPLPMDEQEISIGPRASLLTDAHLFGVRLEHVMNWITIDSQVPLCENAAFNFHYHFGHPSAVMAASASIEVCTSFSLNSLWNCVGRESGGPSSMISRMALVRPIERRFFKRRTRLKAT